jgi:hypothetical protein
MSDILLGFEIDTGSKVEIETTHMVVTGVTNKSGKTTLLEGLASRAEGQKFLVFRSKPDEQAFKEGHFIKPFLSEQSDWRYMRQLLESSEKTKMKFETWHIVQAAKNTKSLGGFYENCVEKAKSSKREFDRQIFEVLAEYTKTLLDEMKDVVFTRDFPELKVGINIMDLSDVKDEDIQSIIIRSSLDYVLFHLKNIITIIPELWKFSPEKRNNPVKEALQSLVRQGATKKNFIWADSQDLAGTDKSPLKQCYTWILGLQTESNEAKHTLDQVNLPPKTKPKPFDITSLSLGQFFLSTPKGSTKFYALPRWLNEDIGIKVAKGKMDAEMAFTEYAPKDQAEELTNPVLMQEVKAQKFRADEEARLRDKAEQEIKSLQKQLEEMETKQQQVEVLKTIEVVSPKLSTLLANVPNQLATLKPLEETTTKIIDTGLPSINIASEEIDVKINTTFRPENFTTDNAEGKIMYTLCVEFQGKFVTYADLKTAIRAHMSWVMDDSTFSNSKKALRERNMIYDDSSRVKLRLPLKVHGIFIDGKQVNY